MSYDLVRRYNFHGNSMCQRIVIKRNIRTREEAEELKKKYENALYSDKVIIQIRENKLKC